MILTKPQAEAVYSAMCALNNVTGKVNATFMNSRAAIEGITAFEDTYGEVHVWQTLGGVAHNTERYENQAAFATAYSLLAA